MAALATPKILLPLQNLPRLHSSHPAREYYEPAKITPSGDLMSDRPHVWKRFEATPNLFHCPRVRILYCGVRILCSNQTVLHAKRCFVELSQQRQGISVESRAQELKVAEKFRSVDLQGVASLACLYLVDHHPRFILQAMKEAHQFEERNGIMQDSTAFIRSPWTDHSGGCDDPYFGQSVRCYALISETGTPCFRCNSLPSYWEACRNWESIWQAMGHKESKIQGIVVDEKLLLSRAGRERMLSQKGNQLWEDEEGHLYRKQKVGNRGKEYWVCVRDKSSHCPGRAISRNDRLTFNVSVAHSHPADIVDNELRSFRSELREAGRQAAAAAPAGEGGGQQTHLKCMPT
ncbi:unnamed protein product [Cyprideis torosa]|uniref:Uncharacterized protein n=1 Tax=Cyprideis torosa TaxID=163714 RepID=A0A7R8WML6_9CRUS|nr:unnamed protein product [Cyprideis torosa]CAG0898612.1 unnamed protein product [Cyprideis torosa]